MRLEIVIKELLKQKTMSLMVGLFILLSSLLAASGSAIIVEMTNSLDALFSTSKVPHFVQMHAGEIEDEELTAFAQSNSLVKNHQVSEILQIDSANMNFERGGNRPKESLMDHYFTTQNQAFDYLLNLNSDIIEVNQGEIAIPLYTMQREQIEIGDTMTIAGARKDMEFTVVDFVRDAQMNPSIIHSKRYVVDEKDFNELKKNTGTVEYLIEFLLTDMTYLNDFRNAYDAANLPAKGPTIDYHMFTLLHAVTDGVVVAVILIVSVIFSLIALCCLRYTLLTTIAEDEREIGIMRAIGITAKDIKSIYLLKYSLIASSMIMVGYLGSIWFTKLFTDQLTLYLGTAPKSPLQQWIPFMTVLLLLGMMMLFCLFSLRRINRVSAMTALTAQALNRRQLRWPLVWMNRMIPVQLFLSLRDMALRYKSYGILLFIFIMCSFTLVVPLHFYNTMTSPSFIQYLGVEKSDIRIDLHQADNIEKNFHQMKKEIQQDPTIDKYATSVTSNYQLLTDDGTTEKITIETGDFSIFPLTYAEGKAPEKEKEITLSYLNSKELDKTVGDTLQVIIDGKAEKLVVTGIYQDVTNGGRTAKAMLPPDDEGALWYKISMDVAEGTALQQKVQEYQEQYPNVKITGINHYVQSTFGNTLEQLHQVITLLFVLVSGIVVFITSLFFNLLLTRDISDIAIYKSIGFSSKAIQIQYVGRAIGIIIIGTYSGIFIANTIGPVLTGFLLSFIGASEITFLINPIQTYLLIPGLWIMMITVITWMSTRSIYTIHVMDIQK